jgi:hypothetical protein
VKERILSWKGHVVRQALRVHEVVAEFIKRAQHIALVAPSVDRS